MAKAKVKKEELKGKTKDELIKSLLDTRKDQLNLRFQRSGGQLENTAEIRKTRRNIARIKTQLSVQRKSEGKISKSKGGAKTKPAQKTKTTTAKAAKPAAKAKKTAA